MYKMNILFSCSPANTSRRLVISRCEVTSAPDFALMAKTGTSPPPPSYRPTPTCNLYNTTFYILYRIYVLKSHYF